MINNPFWWSADDKFFNYALAAKLGVAVPPTVLLPHKKHPTGTTDRSMRNLEYPLDWDGIFRYVGFPAFLKPHDGGGWKNVYKVDTPEELFAAYDESEQLCMTLQGAVKFQEYFRCYVIDQEKVHVMRYDPGQPHHLRYVPGNPPPSPALGERMVGDALKLCRALGYDLNTVEFAVEDGIPYAIDFMNPAPDAGLESVGPENFRWIVEAVADMAISRALGPPAPLEYRWAKFLGAWSEAFRLGHSERSIAVIKAVSIERGNYERSIQPKTDSEHRNRRGIPDGGSGDAGSSFAYPRGDRAEGQADSGRARQAGNAPVRGGDRHRGLQEHHRSQGRSPHDPPER